MLPNLLLAGLEVLELYNYFLNTLSLTNLYKLK